MTAKRRRSVLSAALRSLWKRRCRILTSSTISTRELYIFHGKEESDFVVEGNVLKKYKGNATDIVIPDTVREIGKDAFRDKRYITSVTMPDHIEIIGMGAFCGCEKLKKVVLPKDLLVIGDATFANCYSLSEIKFPSSLEKIE